METTIMSPSIRARYQARQDFAALRAGIKTPPPVGNSPMVEMFVNEPRIGCGFRRFVVLSVGPRWAFLFHAPSLQQLKVDRVTFDRHARQTEFNQSTVGTIIRRNLEQAERNQIRHSPRAAKFALSAIRPKRRTS
jgi:hypothetical protein